MAEHMVLNTRILNSWFESVTLPVAPACNMMCNFCTRENDCICNGNNPEYLSKAMNGKQAVNWAAASVKKNSRIRLISISGPGEPLYNPQTFETLKRLNVVLPGYIYSVSTNGLLLANKARELAELNVKIVNVSVNTVRTDMLAKLYSRAVNGKHEILGGTRMAKEILRSQMEGIRLCLELGMKVRVNTLCFPGINESEMMEIATQCRKLGVKEMCIIGSSLKGGFGGEGAPDILKLEELKARISKIMEEVEVRTYYP